MTHSGLRLLSTADVAAIEMSPGEVVEVVEGAYLAFAAGTSANPRKLMVKPDDGHSVAYAMLGRDGVRDVVAIKTSYRFDPSQVGPPQVGASQHGEQHYYTSLLLYDDVTGLPIALMDCGRIGSLRTPAVSALLARECAGPDARSALVIGSGMQGQQALPFLLTTLPGLDRLMVYGSHPDGLSAVRAELRRHHPDRDVDIVSDLPAAAADADVVLAVAGAGTSAAVEADWLKPGVLCVLVGHGLAPSTLHQADYVIATSTAQMAVTGTDMVDEHGRLPVVDGELPEVLAGRAPGRQHSEQRVFAYNSGLVITDIALGHQFAKAAAQRGLGQVVNLWN
jgi:ornithine cyclodeaminase/alanine dehydrogenase-like protein (mu-crystallin family)